MHMGPVLFLCVLAQGQTEEWGGSLGVGIGVVRHDQGSSFSAFTLAPAVQRFSPSFYIGAGGAVSLLEQGVWAGQGRADIWAAWGPVGINATAAASTRSDGVGAASGSVIVEHVWGRGRAGAALGAGSAVGGIEGVAGVGAFRLRARGWWHLPSQSIQLSFSSEGTRFYGAWYTDLVGGASIEKPRLVASLWLSARVSGTYESTGAASAALQYFLTPSIALEASGGSYLRDPFQGLPRAGFGAGGVRFFAARRAALTAASLPLTPGPQPLVPQYRGDTAVVRFRMEGAKSVAIAGTWNAWTPAPLVALGDDIWEAALLLRSGTYYFNLVVDGEWVVPGGVAAVSDGMGGLVAVLTVL